MHCRISVIVVYLVISFAFAVIGALVPMLSSLRVLWASAPTKWIFYKQTNKQENFRTKVEALACSWANYLCHERQQVTLSQNVDNVVLRVDNGQPVHSQPKELQDLGNQCFIFHWVTTDRESFINICGLCKFQQIRLQSIECRMPEHNCVPSTRPTVVFAKYSPGLIGYE